jgi:hypothetical protein
VPQRVALCAAVAAEVHHHPSMSCQQQRRDQRRAKRCVWGCTYQRGWQAADVQAGWGSHMRALGT